MRRIAAEAGLPSAARKDSQGICFVGKVDLPEFLKQKIRPSEGDVIEVYDRFYEDNSHYRDVEHTLSALTLDGKPVNMVTGYVSEDKCTGTLGSNRYDPDRLSELDEETLHSLSEPVRYDSIRFETEVYRSGRRHTKKTRWKHNPWGCIIGRHDGAQFFTIGQRHGLNIGGHDGSLFVISTDIGRNIVYVGEGHSHKGLSRSCLRIDSGQLHWIRTDLAMSDGEVRRCRARIRYRQPLQDAWLIMRAHALFILFDEPQRGITSGQFAVWYTDDGEMTGSGTIS